MRYGDDGANSVGATEMTGLSRKPAWLDSLQVHYYGLSIAYLYWSYLLLCIVQPNPQRRDKGS